VALPPGVLSAVGGRLAAVAAALALQRRVGEIDDAPGRVDPHAPWTNRQADDGHDRRTDRARRELLTRTLPALGSVKAIVADRGYRGLNKMAAKRGNVLDIKAPPKGTLGFTPIAPLYRVEHAFARLGRWRRLSRCYEGSAESARAWLEVAALAYLFSPGYALNPPDPVSGSPSPPRRTRATRRWRSPIGQSRTVARPRRIARDPDDARLPTARVFPG
jgi:hypothetical protein